MMAPSAKSPSAFAASRGESGIELSAAARAIPAIRSKGVPAAAFIRAPATFTDAATGSMETATVPSGRVVWT